MMADDIPMVVTKFGKPCLRYNRRGWFKVVPWLSGSVEWGTGRHIAYVRDGVVWPRECQLVCGPYPTAHEAMRNGF